MQPNKDFQSFLIQDKQGEQFEICRIQPQDYLGICRMVLDNKERLQTYFPLTKSANLTPELSRQFALVKSKQFDDNEEYLFVLKSKKSEKIIGLIYIKELHWTKQRGEFAYCIDSQFEGRGITTQVVQSLSSYAFDHLGLAILQIIAHKTNVNSIKVAEKCNFTWLRTLENSYTPPGKLPLDMELYERHQS